MSATADRVRVLVEPLVGAHDVALYDLEFTGGQLRVLVTRDGGVDLDTIAEVTRAISRALDDADPITGRYTLEVSSPGLERPLRTTAQFEGAVGELVTVKANDGDDIRRVRGVLLAADTDSIRVRDEADDQIVELTRDSIDKARTVFVWQPAPKPGGSPSRSKKKRKAKVNQR